MTNLTTEHPAVIPLVVAGLLLAAIPYLQRLGLSAPSATDVISATGAGRSRAYEVKAEIEALLPGLARPPGRPPEPEVAPVPRPDITGQVLSFVMDHPGTVEGNGPRRRYSDAFRRFVLELCAAHKNVSTPEIAAAAHVPESTLKDWLSGGVVATPPEKNLATKPVLDPTGPQMETLLAVWKGWSGTFSAFCTHAQQHWRLPFGRTLIANILTAYGVRFAKRRSGRSPDEDALRAKFLTFFPGAQWVGDGTMLRITLDGEPFTFNLELMVDPASGAFVGASLRDTEDALAVIEAVADGVATTGEPPLAVLLDNKTSNHAETVVEALGETVIIPATIRRPQNKAHIEGGFGLFQQVVPALVITAQVPRELARRILELVVTTWARTLNHRPRKDRAGRSRVELYLDHVPTPQEIAAAKAALDERLRRQRRARETLAARQDPLVRQTLAEALQRLAFADPDGQFVNAIARYPLDAILEGIAVVTGKRAAGTLPEGVDARYLMAVVRNIAEEREGWEIALALWAERSRARDRALEAVERDREQLDELTAEAEARIPAYIDRALATTRRIDRFYWLTAAADVVLEQDDHQHEALFRLGARRVHATRAVPNGERLAATRFLAAKIRPTA